MLRLVSVEAMRPFDLSHDPLLRVTLLQLGVLEHVLVLTMHHIVSDGWSMAVLIQELAALYEAFLRGKPSPLAELPIQYADFAHWQRQWLQGEVLAHQLSYWQQQLAGAKPVLELPTDRPRPAVQTFRGASTTLALPAPLSQELKSLSQRSGVTLFMSLLAAFQTLLYRYSEQEDILVGTPIANRNSVEIEGLIGFFANTLVLATDMKGNPSFRELLARVREVALQAYAHQDLPFEKLVEELQPSRNLSHSPLFQVMFQLLNDPVSTLKLAGLTVNSLKVDSGTAKFDLSLSMVDTEQGLIGSLEYNTDLFDAGTINRMLGHFQTLLEGIVANPEQQLSDLPLLTAAQRHQLLVEWNDTQADYPLDVCIHQLFAAQVERSPDAVAVVFEDEQLTYRELNCRANQLAHHLQKLGVGPEVLVGICVERSVKMVVGLLGILKAGGAYVPLDPTYPQERLSFMLEDAQVTVLLTQQCLLEELPKHCVQVVCLDTSWRFELVSDRDGVASGKAIPNQKALPTAISQESEQNPDNRVSARNLAYVIYTSGSTGKPKGVAVSHQAVNRLVCNTNYVNLEPKDVVAQVSNCSFDAATFEIWGALLHGARLVGIARDVALSPNDFAAQLLSHGISVLFLTTALFNQLVKEVPSAFNSVQHLLFGGEAVDPRWIKQVLKNEPPQRLLHVYGPTESTTFASWHLVPDVPFGSTTIPIGRPVSNTQIYLLDAQFVPVPIGVPGELYIAGAGLARGYLNRPDLTAERFIPNPFSNEPGSRLYKTGDNARYLPDGNIEFLGRIDQQVKIRGFRIELGEVEAVLVQHRSVRTAVVIAWEDMPGKKRLVAYLVAREQPAPPITELRSFLKKKLPDYMVPSAFIILDALPLTPNGKVDRSALPAPEQAGPELSGSFVAPQNPLQHQLAQIWEELLDIQPIGIKDNFFELGGHSLLAVRMMHQIEKVCGKKIPLSTLFAEATVEHLASVLLEQQSEDLPFPIMEIQSGGSKSPFFFLHGDFNGGGFYCLNLARYLGKDQPFYALPPHGSDGVQMLPTIEAMAADYLEKLRAFQPEGPYLLGGFCNGGLVAFEMARQLHAQDQKVDLLVLINTFAANALFKFFHKFVSWFGYFLDIEPDKQLRCLFLLQYYFIRFPHFSRLRIDEQLTIVLKKVRKGIKKVVSMFTLKSGGVRACTPETPPDMRGNLIFRAMNSYIPQLYPDRVTLFVSSELPVERSDYPTLGWYKVAQEVDVHLVPGDHSTSITTYVQVLAEKLKTCLDKAQADSRNGLR